MKKYNIVVLDGKGMNPGDMSWSKIEKLGNATIYDDTDDKDLVKRAYDANILIINKPKITKELLEKLPNLKYICITATGYDNIDIVAARKRNIPVSNVKGYSTNSVVQQVYSLLLAIINRPEYYDKRVHEGKWQESKYFTFGEHTIRELSGKTMGIYGFGNIGGKVAAVAKAFGMNVIALRSNPDKGYNGLASHASFNELLANSDILSLHAPSTKDNAEIFDKQAFAKMKSSSILINTARGKLVNEQDLADALNTGIIAGAGLDVLASEPPKDNNPLLTAKNCVITPHQAWTSLEARELLMEGVAKNVEGFIRGEEVNVVN